MYLSDRLIIYIYFSSAEINSRILGNNLLFYLQMNYSTLDH